MTNVHLVEYGGRPLWVVASIEFDLWVYLPRTGRFHLNNGLGTEQWTSETLDFTSVGVEEARRLALDSVGEWEPDDLPTSLLDWDTEAAPMTVDGVFALLLDAEAHPKDYDALRMYVIKNEDGDPHLVGAATELDVWTYVANTGKFHRNEGAWYYVFDHNEFEYDEITIEQARQLMDAGLGQYDEVEDPHTVQQWRADTTAREPEEVFERVMKTLDSAENLDEPHPVPRKECQHVRPIRRRTDRRRLLDVVPRHRQVPAGPGLAARPFPHQQVRVRRDRRRRSARPGPARPRPDGRKETGRVRRPRGRSRLRPRRQRTEQSGGHVPGQ